jgi:hypothetical protein
MTTELVYREGNNWVWSHNPAYPDAPRPLEPLPHDVQTKKQVRDFILGRYQNHVGILMDSKDLRIKWS